MAIDVYYSEGVCTSPNTLLGGFKLPIGTVMEYSVQPKSLLKLNDLEFNRTLYKRNESSHQIGYATYYNERDAILIEVHQALPDSDIEFVSRITYGRNADNLAKFKCSSD